MTHLNRFDIGNISSQARRQGQPNQVTIDANTFENALNMMRYCFQENYLPDMRQKYQDRFHWHLSQAVRVEKRLKLLGSRGYVDDKVILEDEMQAYMIEGQCC